MFKVSQRNLAWYCPPKKEKKKEKRVVEYSLVSLWVRWDLYCFSSWFCFWHTTLLHFLEYIFFFLNHLLPNFGSYFPMLSSGSLLVSPWFNKVVSCFLFYLQKFSWEVTTVNRKAVSSLSPRVQSTIILKLALNFGIISNSFISKLCSS